MIMSYTSPGKALEKLHFGDKQNSQTKNINAEI